MAGTPLVEPAAPELRAHLRGIGAQLAEAAELLVDVGTRTEVHRPCEVVKAVLLEVARPVALEERQFLAIDAAQAVANLRHIGLVLAIGAVLILHLNHDNRTTILDGQRLQLLAHFLLENLYAFHKIRIALAQTDVLLLQQPPGQTAHFPLSADIGTGAHDDIETVFLCQAAEFCHVVVAREVELVFLLLMDVPEDVDAHGIHAQRLAHLDAMLPVGTGNTGIMDFGSLYDERFAVEQECSLADGERAGLAFRCCRRSSVCHCRNSQQQRCQREDGNDFSQFHNNNRS